MAQTAKRGIRAKIGLLPTLFLVGVILYVARDVLIPLAVAILLAFLLTPGVAWLERRRLGRFLSIVFVVGAVLTMLGTITWVVEHQLVQVVAQLPDYRDNIQDKLRRIRGAAQGNIVKAAADVDAALRITPSTSPATRASASVTFTPATPVPQPPGTAAPASTPDPPVVRGSSESWSLSRVIDQYSSQVLRRLATMGLILVFVIIILANRKDLRDRILRLVGEARLQVTTQALDDVATRITHYLLIQSAINAVYGICVGIGLWIIGVCSPEGRFPNLLLWALLAMLFRFVPYLGPWIAAALPLVLSMALFSSAGVLVSTLSLYVGLELVTSNVLEPWLYGATTGMSAVAVLASAVFWTWLWGPVGLLLSTPLAVCLVVLGKYVPQFECLSVLLGDEASKATVNESG